MLRLKSVPLFPYYHANEGLAVKDIPTTRLQITQITFAAKLKIR